jgi:NADH dehydrogenase/NADH:ubiquinone oxidoreductase subunit G
MSRTEKPTVKIVVDGVEIEAPEGEMLVDAATGGAREIPVLG